MSGDGYTGKAIQDISGIAYTEIQILFIHLLFTQATSTHCQRLTLTLLVLNKVTNHHTQQNRVNTVSVIGGISVHQGSETPNDSTLEKYSFFCACGSWLLQFQLEQLARPYLYRTILLMPSQTRKMPTCAGK